MSSVMKNMYRESVCFKLNMSPAVQFQFHCYFVLKITNGFNLIGLMS